jgi:hypothetical protein
VRVLDLFLQSRLHHHLIHIVYFTRILRSDLHRLALKDGRNSHPLAYCVLFVRRKPQSYHCKKKNSSSFSKQGVQERVRAPLQTSFRRAASEKSNETKQRTSYARWPLAASAVNKTSTYLLTPWSTVLLEKLTSVCR